MLDLKSVLKDQIALLKNETGDPENKLNFKYNRNVLKTLAPFLRS